MTWKAEDITHRACIKCREILPNAEFYHRNDGYINYTCKPCNQKKQKRHRELMKKNLWWRVKQSEQSKAYIKRKKESKL